MAWKWTDSRMGIIEYLRSAGHEVVDASWWEQWAECQEERVLFHGWNDIVMNRGEYNRRMKISLEYQHYCGWWKSEGKKPRSVSDNVVYDGVRAVE